MALVRLITAAVFLFNLHALYDVYGVACNHGNSTYPKSGCNFYYFDGVNLSKIVNYQDPDYQSSYALTYNTWTYYDSHGYTQSYTGYGRESTTGVLYNDQGFALNDTQAVNGRDKARTGAVKEKLQVREAAVTFLESHPALSEAGAERIALNLNAWATLIKDRSVKAGRTEADVADFSQRIFGVSKVISFESLIIKPG